MWHISSWTDIAFFKKGSAFVLNGNMCLICFSLVSGPYKAYWLWRDGRVWPSEATSLLRHYLLEWSTHTDTPEAHSVPASHVWGWWGLLWKCKYFVTVQVALYLSRCKCDALLKGIDFPILRTNHKSSAIPFLPFHSMMISWASSATCRWPSPAHHTPCRLMNPRPLRGPAATLSSTSTT